MTVFQLVAFVAGWLVLSVVLGMFVGAALRRADRPCDCTDCCEMGRTPDVAPHGRRVRVRSISERPGPEGEAGPRPLRSIRNGDAPAP